MKVTVKVMLLLDVETHGSERKDDEVRESVADRVRTVLAGERVRDADLLVSWTIDAVRAVDVEARL